MTTQPYFEFTLAGFAGTADVLLEVEGQNLPAHSQFLACQSQFMHNMLQDLSEPQRACTAQHLLVIPADMLSAFSISDLQAFLCQIYNFSRRQPSSMEEAYQLFKLADQSNSPRLMQFCADYLDAQPDSIFQNTTEEAGALKIALLADKHGLDDLLTRAIRYIAKNFGALQSDFHLHNYNQHRL